MFTILREKFFLRICIFTGLKMENRGKWEILYENRGKMRMHIWGSKKFEISSQ